MEEVVNTDDLLIEQVDADIEEIDMPEELDGDENKPTGKDRKIEDFLIEVTEENIARFTLNDVILPIIGYKTRMPANAEMCKIITDIMAEDKITFEIFERHALLDATSACGSYRKIVGFASEIEYDVVEY